MKLKEIKLTSRRIELLNKMGIENVEDLLRTYPMRYEEIYASAFEDWKPNDAIAFEGIICTPARVIRMPNNQSRTIFSVYAQGQELEVTLFNRPWGGQFKFESPITIFGMYMGKNKVTASSYNFKPLKEQEGLRPVYQVTKNLKQTEMRTIMEKALPFAGIVSDPVPEDLRKKYRLLDKSKALYAIHQPKNEKMLHAALRSLKYEEFLCFQCALQATQTSGLPKESKVFDRSLIQKKIDGLPYPLTADQSKALSDILDDMESDTQMFRMVQGDVGCGKTIVAALSLYACLLSGKQAALLAPTEILARQHLANLEKLGMEARLLTSSLPKKEIRSVKDELKNGTLPIVVGTHSLFQESVEFDNLGLVIADEQQRFGVRQRRALIDKGLQTDFLMMSATPIPRTYAHFLFGDIAMSSIKTMPPGRKPVLTHFVSGTSMGPILPEILRGVQEGRQVYVVCPAVEDNPEVDMISAEQIYAGMDRILGGRISIGLLHGKMKAGQKEEVMQAFARGEIQILVATTVVEVGIDVPNATLMVIYDAHRFGLSTLHQLRGRAARGSVQGECYLLSATKDPLAKKRLKSLETMLDGFEISSFDLSSRGPGDLLGTRQSGLPAFILGDFEKDPAIMETALQDAKMILERRGPQDQPMLAYIKKAAESSYYMD